MGSYIDLLALHLVGGRLLDEPSHALERHKYGDPANFVRFEREAMDENNLHQLCLDWREWCFTRRIFMPKGGGTVLGKMQPTKSHQEPDAVMDARLSYFNMAVHALVDMGDDNAECFVTFYGYQRKNVKAESYRMKISRPTYYERVKKFSERAQRLAGSFERMQVTAKVFDDAD